MKILKNTTTVIIELDMGISLQPNSARTVNVQDYIKMSSDTSLEQLDVLIDNEDIIVNDGTDDLSPEAGKAFIRYPDEARNIKYDNSTSGLNAHNVQDAIDAAIGGDIVGTLTYGILDNDIHIPEGKALVLVNPEFGEHEVIIEGELVCL